MNRVAGRLVAVVAIAAGVATVVSWRTADPARDFHARLPGTDHVPGIDQLPDEGPAEITGTLRLGDGIPAELTGAWPCFRNAARDGIARDTVRLARRWPASGPPVLWSIELGEGHAGAAIRAGRVYVLDYDRDAKADVLRCLSLADGREIWSYAYPVSLKRNHGMSRTVPAVTDKYVVSFGPKCHVLCLDAATGERKWVKDLNREYHTKEPPWYAGQCPLIDGDRVILAPGGDALMVALDCETGQSIWQTPNPRGWSMTHSSITPMTIDGRQQYVHSGSGGVAGVAADNGELLWDTSEWRISIATIASPVAVDGSRIFLSGGYNAGAMMLRVAAGDDGPLAEPIYRLPPKVFGATQQTPILFERHLYGVRPDRQFTCLALDGRPQWASGATDCFGLGPFLIADGLIYALADDGELVMAELNTLQWRPLGRAKVLDGPDAWGPMAIADGRLIARDLKRMVCLDVRAERQVTP